MKASFLLRVLFPGIIAAGHVMAQAPAASPLSQLPQTAPEAETGKSVARSDGESIIRQSTILHDGENWTIVPKGAVLHVPEKMRARVDAKPVGTLLAWADFLTKNHAWLTANEINFDQAAGNQPIPADLAGQWAKQEKVVVAVHNAGPISVRVANTAAAADDESQIISQR